MQQVHGMPRVMYVQMPNSNESAMIGSDSRTERSLFYSCSRHVRSCIVIHESARLSAGGGAGLEGNDLRMRRALGHTVLEKQVKYSEYLAAGDTSLRYQRVTR